MLVLNGSASIADVVALADRREQVSVSPQVVEAVGHAHQVAADLSTRFAIYGRTTGVGANRATSVSPTDSEYGMRLLRSHAVDAGDPLDARTVRAMLAVRLIQLCVPGAGLDPRDLVRARDDAQRRRATRTSSIRVDRDRRPRATRGHGI